MSRDKFPEFAGGFTAVHTSTIEHHMPDGRMAVKRLAATLMFRVHSSHSLAASSLRLFLLRKCLQETQIPVKAVTTTKLQFGQICITLLLSFVHQLLDEV